MSDLNGKEVVNDAEDRTLENMGYQHGESITIRILSTFELLTDFCRAQALLWPPGYDRIQLLDRYLVRPRFCCNIRKER